MTASTTTTATIDAAIVAAAASAPTPRHSRSPVLRFLARLFLFVGLPTATACVYYGFVASDIYVSETRFAIRSVGQQQPDSLFSSLLQVGGGITSEDTIIVRDYVLSRVMLDMLEERLDLKDHYTAPEIDWWSRLSPSADYEKFLEYYQDKTQLVLETGTGVITLTARAFTPDMAQAIAVTLVEESERLVNRMSERIQTDTLALVREEVQLAEDKVRAASATLTTYRSETRLVDPVQETGAVLQIITGLESSLADTRAELSEMKSFMQGDSAKVKGLEARVVGLRTQIHAERARIAGSGDSNLNDIINGYLPLALDEEFAQRQYASALEAYELARAELQRKQRYLEPFVPPDRPRIAREPERVKTTVTVFAGVLILYAIGGLIVSAFREHTGL